MKFELSLLSDAGPLLFKPVEEEMKEEREITEKGVVGSTSKVGEIEP
jgi:hypothetical protein